MFRKLVIGALGAMAVLFSTTAFAEGTAADAKAMLEKTVAAIKAGASVFKMMDVSRHKSIETLRGYVRDAEMFQNHAGSGLL